MDFLPRLPAVLAAGVQAPIALVLPREPVQFEQAGKDFVAVFIDPAITPWFLAFIAIRVHRHPVSS